MTAYAEPTKVTSPTLHTTTLFTVAVFATILAMSLVVQGRSGGPRTGTCCPCQPGSGCST